MSRVLIHTFNRELLRRLQDTICHAALPAECKFSDLAMEAVAIAHDRGSRYDVLVVDVTSPHCWFLCEEVKQTGWQTEIIFLAYHDNLEARQQAATFNCAGFLKLPDELAEIPGLLRALVEKS